MSNQNELNSTEMAARIAGLMPSASGANPFFKRYADCLEKAVELDDLSFVRMGNEAEAFEAEFRQFVSEFPGMQAVTDREGAFADMGTYLARLDRELRRTLLKGWAGIIRAKTHQGQHRKPSDCGEDKTLATRKCSRPITPVVAETSSKRRHHAEYEPFPGEPKPGSCPREVWGSEDVTKHTVTVGVITLLHLLFG